MRLPDLWENPRFLPFLLLHGMDFPAMGNP